MAVTVRGAVAPRPDENGSVVVVALALSVVAAVVVGTAASRVLGSVSASTAEVDRVQARRLAEHALELGLADLAHGIAGTQMRAGGSIDRSLELDAPQRVIDESRVGQVRVELEALTPREGVTVTSEVRVGAAVHRASALVRPHLTIDHAWVAEHGSVDPALLRVPRAACAWDRDDPRRASGCVASNLGPGVVVGPLHSNDAVALARDTVLNGPVTTAHLSAGPAGTAVPTALSRPDGGGTDELPGPAFLPHVALPRDAGAVLAGATVTCRFRGPTLLRFDGAGVRVTSPRSVPRAGESTAPSDVIGCMGVDRETLAGVVVVTLPQRAVIEVVRDELHDCVSHPLGLDSGEDTEHDWWCSGGDAFVWGRYRGARTVVAHDNVQIVWDLEPGDAASATAPDAGDLLGLVAGDSIVLRRPVGRPVRRIAPYGQNLPFAGAGVAPFGAYPLDAPNATATTWDAPRIVASLAALRGSVHVQNPFRGEHRGGPLRIDGSVAGRFSSIFSWEEVGGTGAVLGTMGYPLELVHDDRLTWSTPPAMPVLAHGRLRVLALDVG
jgi:hypothetical protein